MVAVSDGARRQAVRKRLIYFPELYWSRYLDFARKGRCRNKRLDISDFSDCLRTENPPAPGNEELKPMARAEIPRFGVVCLRKLTHQQNSRWRAKNKKTPQKHKNTPQKRKSTPQKHKTPLKGEKNAQFFFRAYARKRNGLLPKTNCFCWYAQTTSNAGNSRSAHGGVFVFHAGRAAWET